LTIAGLIVGCGPKTGPAANGKIDSSNKIEAPDKPSLTADSDVVVATAGDVEITETQLMTALKEAHGFGMLMYLVQRELAFETCRQMGMTVSDADIDEERQWTLNQMFENAREGEDRENLLDQYLAQPKPRDQMMTRTEFDIIISTNAAMRKIAKASLKNAISDEDLKMHFDQLYGASVKVRHIMVSNPQELQKVQRLLAAGEDFAAVARAESRNPETKRVGGELPPFTINDARLPENFRRVAFALKENEVSDPVQAGGSYHLIKLEKRIDPKAVKFEDVKDSLRDSIQDRVIIEGVKEIRNRLAQQALAVLKVEDPVLKAEFDKRLAARDKLIRDREKIKEEMEKQRQTPTTSPMTDPTPAPATVPATVPETDDVPMTQP
jgi:parvulin-like peptidyl-prolyl isomerase